MAPLRARSAGVRPVRVYGAGSEPGVRAWRGWEWTRGGDGRRVGDDVGLVVRRDKQADGQGGRDAGEELWGGVAGVGKESALSLGSRRVLNGV